MKLLNNISRFAVFFDKKSPLSLTTVLWFLLFFVLVTYFDGIDTSLSLVTLLGAIMFDTLFQYYVFNLLTKKSNYANLSSKFAITILIFALLNYLVYDLMGFLLVFCLFGIALIFTIGMYFFIRLNKKNGSSN